MPQSILTQREMIGVFEFIDHNLDVSGKPVPDWVISAGSRSLKFLEFPTQKVQWDRLRSKYGLSTYDKLAARDWDENDLIDQIPAVNEACRGWFTEVLYFTQGWFDEASRQMAQFENVIAANAFFSYFKDSGWNSLARVRDRANKLEDAINEWGGDNGAARCKAAYLLVRYCSDIVHQRRPCFVPFAVRPETGPFEIIREKLLGVARLNRNILGPVYVLPGEAGFVSLSQLAPTAFACNPKDSLEDIVKIISRARRTAAGKGVDIPYLTNVSDLFSKLSFRIKSGRDRGKGQHGLVSTFKIDIDPPNGKLFERVPIPIAEFYAPYFTDNSMPPSDSRFFSVAVKIDLRCSG